MADPALFLVNSLSPSTEVNTAWDYTLPTPYVFVGRCFIKHTGHFKSYYHTYMGYPVQLGEIQAMTFVILVCHCSFGGNKLFV